MHANKSLAEIGERILNSVKTELYLNMRFLSQALGVLGHTADLGTTGIGTDAASVRFNPRYLIDVFLERPEQLNRIYMHCLTHCLFLHMFSSEKYDDEELWDIACDIAVEALIDGMDNEILLRVVSDERQRWYDKLGGSVRVLSAEQIYRYLKQSEISYDEILVLKKEFCIDDHSFWKRLKKDNGADSDNIPDDIDFLPQADLPLKEEWEKLRDKVRMEMEVSGSDAGNDYGRLTWMLKLQAATRTDFREFLKRLMIIREEIGVDPETFDLAYYNLGMTLYGNMPLIEEVELVERESIQSMVIAIDTSASTKRTMVQKFLNQCLGILRSKEYFFNNINLHIIECDDRIQRDIKLKDVKEIEKYIDRFEVSGGYGTDFRPVFEYVKDLIIEKELPNLRGLLYFTDGYGEYPKMPPPYDTGFVFVQGEDYDDTKVPDWAVKLYAKE